MALKRGRSGDAGAGFTPRGVISHGARCGRRYGEVGGVAAAVGMAMQPAAHRLSLRSALNLIVASASIQALQVTTSSAASTTMLR